jgi:hypothetical protein
MYLRSYHPSWVAQPEVPQLLGIGTLEVAPDSLSHDSRGYITVP